MQHEVKQEYLQYRIKAMLMLVLVVTGVIDNWHENIYDWIAFVTDILNVVLCCLSAVPWRGQESLSSDANRRRTR